MASNKKPTERDHANDLLIEWAPEINRIINSMSKNLPPHVDKEDLYSVAHHGLMDAFRLYDPSKGASFKTYVSGRIKNTLGDHISGGDAVPVDKYFYEQARNFKRPKQPEQSQPQPTPEIDTTPEVDIKPDTPKKV